MHARPSHSPKSDPSPVLHGRLAAYAKFGATLTNERWSWSARTADGRVVLTLWKDEFNYKTKPVSYDCRGNPRLSKWMHRLGNGERIENLKWAKEHADGKFWVVIATVVDKDADVRKIAEAYARPEIVMRLTDLDEDTGEFRAEMATEATMPPAPEGEKRAPAA